MNNKPADYDNSWLGVTGITIATLYHNNKIIGTTLDTPNAVAYAKGKYPQITKAVGICGEYDMKDIESRIWFSVTDENLSKGLKITP